ncbi:hypothetical protein [Deinococcus sp. NW-56]|uniref:hypothetical protein n=1 Tax=Deinococcus sp. NW-56 TaxID=2080419 RepID=UPI00131A1DC0|nr:hypothetical protein [Deinococcus sp. NW-56]
MRYAAPLALTLAYLGCLYLAGTPSAAAYPAAVLGPLAGFLALAALLARLGRTGGRA